MFADIIRVLSYNSSKDKRWKRLSAQQEHLVVQTGRETTSRGPVSATSPSRTSYLKQGISTSYAAILQRDAQKG